MKTPINYPKNQKQQASLNSKNVLTIEARPTGESFFSHQKLEFHDLKEAQQTGFNSIPSISIENMIIGASEPEYFGDWHPAPFPLLFITLEGIHEVEVYGGEKRALRKGEMLFEAADGKPVHRSTTIGNENTCAVVIEFSRDYKNNLS